jgi:XFP-like protein
LTPSGSSRLTHCLPSLGAADAIDHHGDWVAAARTIAPGGVDAAHWLRENAPDLKVRHGYQRAIHEIVHGHVDVDRFHVRGFSEQGTTTTPFDMVVLNGMSRYHLAAEALRRAGDAGTPLARDWGIAPRP